MSNIDIFKMNVRKFNTIENEIKHISSEIKPYNEKLKELKTQKKDLEKIICSYMNENEIDQCKLEDSCLINKEKKSIIPLKKNDIKENIIKFFNDNFNDKFIKLSSLEKSDLLFNFIYKENRGYNEKYILDRKF
tara:strand:+ start:531 stop:932 length:402 start_codon:yes stop_codon:yes gene_type:complete